MMREKHLNKTGAGLIALIALLSAAFVSAPEVAAADNAAAMAPPVQASGSAQSVSGDNVFNWTEVPSDQNVPLKRAVFDREGYTLYDQADETIVVPFTNNNLYVMKFAVSQNGTMYFVHTDSEPVLYLPENGYLENASDPGAHWYPFTPKFHPATPVFLGCAPSWPDYVAMGWYPGMAVYGGYWYPHPWFVGAAFWPSFGFFIGFGNVHFFGWGPFVSYCGFHPAPYHVTIVNERVFQFAGRPGPFERPFWGGPRPFLVSGRTFAGTGHPVFLTRAVPADRQSLHEIATDNREHNFAAARAVAENVRSGKAAEFSATHNSFRGAPASFNGHADSHVAPSTAVSHEFHGARSANGESRHEFHGAQGMPSEGRSAGSGGHEFHGAQSTEGGRSFHGASDHSFHGSSAGYQHSSAGGGHSFNSSSGPSHDSHSSHDDGRH